MSNHDKRIAARRGLELWLENHGAALESNEREAIEAIRAGLPDTPLSHEEKRQHTYRLADKESKR